MNANDILSWSTIGKLVITGVAIYVIQPILLIARDAALWALIDRYILNAQLRIQIYHMVEAEAALARLPTRLGVRFEDGQPMYEADGERISKARFDKLENAIDNTSESLSTMRSFVSKRRRQLEWLLRHYKQPEKANPIDEWIAQAKQHREQIDRPTD